MTNYIDFNKIFVTSDLHLNHNKDFVYKERGFNSIAEHNEAIVRNWNTTVSDNDIVYVLGDSMLNDDDTTVSKYLKQLRGHIFYIIGNHDTARRLRIYESIGWKCLGYAHTIQHKKQSFYLSHYPTLCGNYDEDRPLNKQVINICGHTHTKNPFDDFNKGLIYHVDMDAHNCTPVNIDTIVNDIKERNELVSFVTSVI